jgi:hypothetical protein
MKRVYKFWCTNCTCGLDKKGSERDFEFELEEGTEGEELICPNIDEDKLSEDTAPLKLMGEKMFAGYLKTSNYTPQQKRQMLKKRSSQHFQKEIRDRKEQTWKNFLTEAKSHKR